MGFLKKAAAAALAFLLLSGLTGSAGAAVAASADLRLALAGLACAVVLKLMQRVRNCTRNALQKSVAGDGLRVTHLRLFAFERVE